MNLRNGFQIASFGGVRADLGTPRASAGLALRLWLIGSVAATAALGPARARFLSPARGRH